MAAYLEQSLAKLEEFEGSIPWMYLDTVGRVTVGVGLMLPHAAAAAHLPFCFGERNATEEEIAAEFSRVDGLPMGRAALFYRRKDGPELGKPEIDSLLLTVLKGFEGELRAHLTGYESYPDGVKMALLDMAYNLGPAGLLNGYPRLLKAVESGAWTQAAAVSFRHGPGATRNQWTRTMFLQNVVGSVTAVAESGVKRFGYGLIGLGADLWSIATRRK
jgi:GH24 family phage-related lysozyme (muramidase)